MQNEAFKFSEQEKQKRKKTDFEKRKAEEQIIQAKKARECISEEEHTEHDLRKLKNLLDAHILDDALVEKVMCKTEISHDDIEEIFEKIDELEALKNIDDYLPKEQRVSKQEYAAATHDDEAAKLVIVKIEWCLTVLAHQANPVSIGGSMNLFSGFLTMLDKNLITIQEHHIDMKESLEKETKVKGIWESLKEGFR